MLVPILFEKEVFLVRRLLQLLPLLLVLMVPIAACGGPPATVPASTGSTTQALTFTDATHTTITLPKRPARIACLVSLCEDILAELGLTPVAVNDTLRTGPCLFWKCSETLYNDWRAIF